ncbi:MAG: lipocalin-like domain-containing protein [Tannerella sp.]|nr:lipocalin-like domain-containing protein [Tannerella sp.]
MRWISVLYIMAGRALHTVSVLAVALAVMVSCEGRIPSQLEGKWQLKTVERNGRVEAVDTVWYNFQSQSIFALQIYRPQEDTYILLYGFKKQTDDILSVEMLNMAYTDLYDWPTDWANVKPEAPNGPQRSFSIIDLSARRLLLRSDEGYNYSFIKF